MSLKRIPLKLVRLMYERKYLQDKRLKELQENLGAQGYLIPTRDELKMLRRFIAKNPNFEVEYKKLVNGTFMGHAAPSTRKFLLGSLREKLEIIY